MTHHDTYELVITRNNGGEILLHDTLDGLTLPRSTAPRHERLPRDLTSAVAADWGVATVCLCSARRFIGVSEPYIQVLECIGDGGPASRSCCWVSSSDAFSLLNPEEGTLLEAALKELNDYASGKRDNLFARPGWLPEVQQWVANSIEPYDLHLNGRLSQLGSGTHYALLRFETNERAVWFKTAGDSPEYEVMTQLPQLALRAFPQVIASRGDWRAWLTMEAPGETLDRVTDAARWINVAAGLGVLQRSFCDATSLLLQVGCVDWRAEKVLPQIVPFFETMRDVMAGQPTNTIAQPLSASQLSVLKGDVQRACDQFYSLRAPASLGSLDFNPTNIISDRDSTTFIDWSAAAVTHPFITFEFLVANLRRVQPALEGVVEECRSAYCATIQTGVLFHQIDRQLRLSPLIAELIYALNSWCAAKTLQTDRWNPLLRSMTRRMFRSIHEAESGLL